MIWTREHEGWDFYWKKDNEDGASRLEEVKKDVQVVGMMEDVRDKS